MSKQAKWTKVYGMFFGDFATRPECVAVTRNSVARVLGVSRTTARKSLSDMVRDGLLVESYDPDYGRFGLYEYWLSEYVLSWEA